MQYAFDFYQDEPKRPDKSERLFFALFLDRITTAVVDRCFRQTFLGTRLTGSRIPRHRYHISLQHLGDYRRLRSQTIYAATQIGNAVSIPPFEVTLSCIKSFEGSPSRTGKPRRFPLVLLGQGMALFELQRRLANKIKEYGLGVMEEFVPHVTLLYGPQLIPMQLIEPIRFVVKDFALVHSELGLTKYNILGRWSLET